ncbi:nucleotidyltransferase domain-containing protein [Candidatus Gottesmanbacteria bacterium]|nr:nucleotidyltransferase domain-containing protein [Candidatus Gottesmanbacteria bacterium]
MDQQTHSFWLQAPDGYLINESSWKKVSRDYHALIEEIKKVFRKHLKEHLYSVYLYGSVAKGKAKRGISDIDVLALTTSPTVTDKEFILLQKAAAQLTQQFPLVSHVQLDIYRLTDVLQSRVFSPVAFTIVSEGVCTEGVDLGDKLSRARPSIALANSELVQLEANIQEAIQKITGAVSSEEVWYWCKRIMKNILRDGFFLVMDKEQKFTSDIALSAQVFAKYYPEKSDSMRRVLALAIEPPDDKNRVINILNEFGPWMINEVNKWLDKNNPERKTQLEYS